MYVKIGEKIKALRKRDDITQEYLAEILGVTNQAVSKWESENSYPDIEYISPIANFFNVTIDYLFDHDTAEKQRKIEAYHEQYMKCMYEPLYYNKQIDIMRNALAEFPAEEALLLHLAQALYGKWCSYGSWTSGEGNGPDIEKHKSFDSWEEAMKIMEKLLASSTDDAIRSKCRYYLSMIYGRTDEKEKLLAIIEKFDPVYYSKENILHFTLFGEEGIKNNQQYLLSLLGLLGKIFYLLPEPKYKVSNTEVYAEAYKILIDLWKLVFSGDEVIRNNPIGNLYCSTAFYLKKSNPDAAVKALEQSFIYAKMYDEFDIGEDEKTYTSPYVNRLTYSRETLGQRNEVQKLLETLTNGGFDGLREIDSFNVLVKEIEDWVNKSSLN